MRPREAALQNRILEVRDICAKNGVACYLNGDVYDRSQAITTLQKYGLDGVMIARGAESNVSCFLDKKLPSLAVAVEVIKVVRLEAKTNFNAGT